MNRRIMVSVIAAILVTPLLAAFAAEPAAKPVAKAKPATTAPEGYVMVEEEIWSPLAEEPAVGLNQAREDLKKKDYKATAYDLRKAAALIRMEASRATGDDKKALERSEIELGSLVAELDGGALKDETLFNVIVGAAHHALAAHHLALAGTALTKGEKEKTAHSMRFSAMYLERAVNMLGYKEQAAATTAIADARTAAGAVLEGTGWVPDEIGKALSALGKEVEKLGAEVEPSR